MPFELPPLPYKPNALEPHISKETLQYHYGKHHQAYVNNLNKLVSGDNNLENSTLEEIILSAPAGGLFNNAAQVWNHTFYWNCLTPDNTAADSQLLTAIDDSFGSLTNFQEKFTMAAVSLFGSGWAWLVKNANQKLEIVGTNNADTPIKHNQTPLLTCDVWEHAYYIDYRNARPKYVETFWKLVNWEFVSRNFAQ